jgi:hypothetical protein
MMAKEKLTRKLTVRMTETEYNRLAMDSSKTTCPNPSSYARRLLTNKPVVIRYRNESMDASMEEIILLKQELNGIGNNFNQAVKKLHTLQLIPEFRAWLTQYTAGLKTLEEKTSHIQNRIDEMSDKWLQE